jgi:diguanylate cyclase (GGDEF)-like protein
LENLHHHDVQGEKAIAAAQGVISCFVLGLHYLARLDSGLETANPWVVFTLTALTASSCVRFRIAAAKTLNNRALDVLNVADIGLFLHLIWTYQYAYGHPAGGTLKAPSFVLLLALVALRALRFHPRPVLIAGVTAVAGWCAIVVLAITQDGTNAITRDYVEFLSSHRILLGAEVEKGVALVGLVLFLTYATHKAREILGQAAHASDYVEALDSARRHLEEATRAKEKAEAALAELDRREAELTEQNRRFNAALANMPPGLCMFDSDQRLLVCNARYSEMYALPPELTKPGTSFLSILKHRVANELYVGNDPQAYIAERLSAARETEPNTKIHELSDGRVIAIKHQPMEHGGWVATHEDITQQRRIEARIAHMARHDALTNLPNRVQLRERMDETLYGVCDESRSLAVLLLNLDRFKSINDTLGHSSGDTLLQVIAERLGAEFRDVDMVARTSGDEFAILKVSESAAEAAVAIAERVRRIIATPIDLDGHPVVIGTSVGITIGPSDGSDSDVLLKNADLALDRAKSDGGGAYCFFEGEMDRRLRERRELEQELHLAIANNEFEVHYQAQLNLERSEISGFEALLRWQHPARGRIPPGDFVPLAEQTGLIVPIGAWILRRACADTARWPRRIKVAVNLSAIQLKAGSVLETVVEALDASGLEPSRLELEVTESVLLDGSSDFIGTLQKLRDLGVRIALDDFGTGYSSLGYLKRFPFDKIKIDRSFVSEISGEKVNSVAIVSTVAALGHSLGIATTAEGVETAEQLAQVRREGYTEIQGYYVSPPLPAAEVVGLLARDMKALVRSA